MTELFYTWKQPSANGSSLFEKEPIKKIDTFLEQARKKHVEHLREDLTRPADFQNQARQFLGNNGLSQASLLTHVDKLLQLTRQRQVSDPSDTDAVKQIDILNQLKSVLGTQKLPESILPDIKQKLIGFTNKEMERFNEKDAARDPRFPQNAGPKGPVPQSKPAPQYNRLQQAPNTHPAGSPFTQQQFQQMANIMSTLARPNPPTAPASFNGVQDPRNNNPQFNLMNMVQPMGYGTPQPQNNQAQQYSQPSNQSQTGQNPMISMSLVNSLMSAGLISGKNNGNNANPLFADIELTSSSLSKPRPNLIRLLYEEMPNSCTSCGKRFQDTEEGRKNRTAHMDWHFRVNKKLREENSQMRCWYISQDDWIAYRDEEEILGLGQNDEEYESDDYNPENNLLGASSGRSNERPGSNRSGAGGAGSNGSSSKKAGKIDYDALKSKFVLVPTNKHLASLPCPICREKFTSEWADDVEAWVWKNAIEVKKRIFHAVCYAETEQTGGELIKRILAQQDVGIGGGNSRGSTPPVSAPSQAPLPAKSIQSSTAADALAALGGLDLAAILQSAKRKRVEDDDLQPSKKERSA